MKTTFCTKCWNDSFRIRWNRKRVLQLRRKELELEKSCLKEDQRNWEHDGEQAWKHLNLLITLALQKKSPTDGV